jgi:hypothetical protein
MSTDLPAWIKDQEWTSSVIHFVGPALKECAIEIGLDPSVLHGNYEVIIDRIYLTTKADTSLVTLELIKASVIEYFELKER